MNITTMTFIFVLLTAHTLLSQHAFPIADNSTIIAAADTIPFTLGLDNRIYIQGTINNEQPIDFIFDTGAEGIWLYKSGLTKSSTIIFHGQSTISGVGGDINSEYSLNNTLRVANHIWNNRTVDYSGVQMHNNDGGIGYKLFEESNIELNFDNGLLIIHDSLFIPENGYTQCRLQKRNNNYFIEVTLNSGVKKIDEWFHFDTGSSGSLNIHNESIAAQNLYSAMKRIGEHKASGIGQGVINFERVILPKLEIGGYELVKIPISLEIPSNTEGLPFGIIGIDILKRFNIILDFQRSIAYLKPNSLFHSFFKN
ncbi:MAG: aspartyl protease family protein [Bacteroidota bacterium]|nr:aspartyl protease family protein [Bacteroidota bacterium]